MKGIHQWKKKRYSSDWDLYISFMRDSVLQYFSAEDRSRSSEIASRARDLVKHGEPDSAIELIKNYVETAGERSMDRDILKALDQAQKARAAYLFDAGMGAIFANIGPTYGARF